MREERLVMSMSNKVGRAIYDFSESPITFDFCVFLAVARLELAMKTGSPDFFLSLRANAWRNLTPRELRYSLDDRLWRLHNLIIPICGITPGILGYDVSFTDEESEVSYDPSRCVRCENGNYLNPALLDVFQRSGFDPHLYAAPKSALDYARRMFGRAREPIVVTVRGSSFEGGRNTGSDFSEELLQSLLDRGKSVFLIPDQETEIETASVPKGVKILHEASFNLPLRLALHELASVSICAAGGPTILLTLSLRKPNLVVYHPVNPDVEIASPKWMAAMRVEIGSDRPYPWLTEGQKWLWDPEIRGATVSEAALSLI